MLGTNRRTPEERRILENWPTVTAEDIGQMNDLFPHYLFLGRTAPASVFIRLAADTVSV